MKKLLRNWRIVLMVTCVVFSLLFITNIIPVNAGKGIGFGNGIDYGLDFAGGTQIQLRLEREVDAHTMEIEKGILENRLNSLGLKDIPVLPWGSQYILVQIAGASSEDISRIEEVLRQQARFEEMIDGELAVLGDEISIDLSPQGTQIYKAPNGYTWAVAVDHSSDGACRFGKVAEGKKGRPVDIFIDRPHNTTLLLGNGTYNILKNISSSGEGESVFFDDSAVDVVEDRANIPVIVYNGDINETLAELLEKKSEGYDKVVFGGDEKRLSNELRNIIEEKGIETERNPKENQTYEDWIKELTGLKSSPRLNFETKGECVYSAQITGVTPTLEEAREEVKTNQVLLTSGNLPAKATIEGRSTTPPTLGLKFLRYAFLTGVLAFCTVSVVVFIRYRQLFIAGPIMFTGLSEVLMILGLASLINWQLDLPAVAGIIAAVGMGVDHQIVITDETLKYAGKKKKVISVSERIRRAFFIIFTAASTTIAAMVPMITIGAGMLKGFAFTTIMGVAIGVLIARPAYAKIIEELLKTRE